MFSYFPAAAHLAMLPLSTGECCLSLSAGTVAIEGGRGGNTLSGLPLNLSEKPQACWLPRLSVNEGSLCVLVTAGTAGQRLLVTVVRTTKLYQNESRIGSDPHPA